MTAERKEAMQLLERMPEDKINLVIQYMQKIEISPKKEDMEVAERLGGVG